MSDRFNRKVVYAHSYYFKLGEDIAAARTAQGMRLTEAFLRRE
jgi:hypothetical protein